MGCLDDLESCDHRSIEGKVVRCDHEASHFRLTNCHLCDRCKLVPRTQIDRPKRKRRKCNKCLKDKKRLNNLLPGLGDATEKVIDVLTFGHGHELGRMLRGDE